MSGVQKFKFNYPDIRVLIFKDNAENAYIAHALEFDLVATGKNETEAKKNLIDTLTVQLRFAFANDMLETVLTDAPREYFERWEAAKKKEVLSLFGDMTKHRVVTVKRPRLTEKAECFDLRQMILAIA